MNLHAVALLDGRRHPPQHHHQATIMMMAAQKGKKKRKHAVALLDGLRHPPQHHHQATIMMMAAQKGKKKRRPQHHHQATIMMTAAQKGKKKRPKLEQQSQLLRREQNFHAYSLGTPFMQRPMQTTPAKLTTNFSFNYTPACLDLNFLLLNMPLPVYMKLTFHLKMMLLMP